METFECVLVTCVLLSLIGYGKATHNERESAVAAQPCDWIQRCTGSRFVSYAGGLYWLDLVRSMVVSGSSNGGILPYKAIFYGNIP